MKTKKTLLINFFFCMLLLSGVAMGQSSGTTWEEYNYVVKGMKDQAAKGLDVEKKGYRVEDGTGVVLGTYAFTFDYLVRTNTNKVACTIMVISGTQTRSPGMFCLPAPNTANDVYSAAFEGIFKYFKMSDRAVLVQALHHIYNVEKFK